MHIFHASFYKGFEDPIKITEPKMRGNQDTITQKKREITIKKITKFKTHF